MLNSVFSKVLLSLIMFTFSSASLLSQDNSETTKRKKRLDRQDFFPRLELYYTNGFGVGSSNEKITSSDQFSSGISNFKRVQGIKLRSVAYPKLFLKLSNDFSKRRFGVLCTWFEYTASKSDNSRNKPINERSVEDYRFDFEQLSFGVGPLYTELFGKARRNSINFYFQFKPSGFVLSQDFYIQGTEPDQFHYIRGLGGAGWDLIFESGLFVDIRGIRLGLNYQFGNIDVSDGFFLQDDYYLVDNTLNATNELSSRIENNEIGLETMKLRKLELMIGFYFFGHKKSLL